MELSEVKRIYCGSKKVWPKVDGKTLSYTTTSGYGPVSGLTCTAYNADGSAIDIVDRTITGYTFSEDVYSCDYIKYTGTNDGSYLWTFDGFGGNHKINVVNSLEFTGTKDGWSSEYRNNFIRSIDLSNFTFGESFTSLIFNCPYLEEIKSSVHPFSGCSITTLSFAGCKQLKSVDLTGLITTGVTSFLQLFSNCLSLSNISGIEELDTSNATNIGGAFENCESLTELDLSGWNTAKVTKMDYLFNDCKSLSTLDLSGWDTSKVMYMQYMFSSCSGLKTLNLSNFNTSNVGYMDYMFDSCSGLKTLDLSNFNTSGVKGMSNMFYNCNSLTTLDLSGWDTSNVTSMGNMFSDCNSLTTIRAIGCSETTISFLKARLSEASLTDKVTVVTE